MQINLAPNRARNMAFRPEPQATSRISLPAAAATIFAAHFRTNGEASRKISSLRRGLVSCANEPPLSVTVSNVSGLCFVAGSQAHEYVHCAF